MILKALASRFFHPHKAKSPGEATEAVTPTGHPQSTYDYDTYLVSDWQAVWQSLFVIRLVSWKRPLFHQGLAQAAKCLPRLHTGSIVVSCHFEYRLEA